MGRMYERIDGPIAEFIAAQPMFFVATAPLAGDGLVNVSPKGMAGTWAVLDDGRVAYLDLTGSGVETIAHVRENGRITLMWCAFAGPPRIVRVHGRGEIVLPEDAAWAGLRPRFADLAGARAIVVVTPTRVSDSCGYAVPRMTYGEDRPTLVEWAERRGPDGLAAYHEEKNRRSLDGLPGLPGPTSRAGA